ncbi:DUF6022 family protein [Paenibacillus sedimenti]|uniref:Uncharacterized protein n=1 Tax=Paenibacillus sedimenti TaxID=2770274 RepID=A0A926KQC3_9BACL|nr:DUF6022 family protein [Paenibacillus sedimenti]MBD0381211.1 hypothetical protein [Paenibacillus sedimenti]
MEQLLLNFKPGMSVEKIGEVTQNYVSSQWKKVLNENMEELTKVFPELEDSTYGLYLDKFIPQIVDALEAAGFTTGGDIKESDFIIGKLLNFRNSMEKWGSEDHRSRVFWIVVEDQKNRSLGTLIFDFFHSHMQFDVPALPNIFAIEATTRKEIITAIDRMKQGDA